MTVTVGTKPRHHQDPAAVLMSKKKGRFSNYIKAAATANNPNYNAAIKKLSSPGSSLEGTEIWDDDISGLDTTSLGDDTLNTYANTFKHDDNHTCADHSKYDFSVLDLKSKSGGTMTPSLWDEESLYTNNTKEKLSDNEEADKAVVEVVAAAAAPAEELGIPMNISINLNAFDELDISFVPPSSLDDISVVTSNTLKTAKSQKPQQKANLRAKNQRAMAREEMAQAKRNSLRDLRMNGSSLSPHKKCPQTRRPMPGKGRQLSMQDLWAEPEPTVSRTTSLRNLLQRGLSYRKTQPTTSDKDSRSSPKPKGPPKTRSPKRRELASSPTSNYKSRLSRRNLLKKASPPKKSFSLRNLFGGTAINTHHQKAQRTLTDQSTTSRTSSSMGSSSRWSLLSRSQSLSILMEQPSSPLKGSSTIAVPSANSVKTPSIMMMAEPTPMSLLSQVKTEGNTYTEAVQRTMRQHDVNNKRIRSVATPTATLSAAAVPPPPAFTREVSC